jgi:hypothetical protein
MNWPWIITFAVSVLVATLAVWFLLEMLQKWGSRRSLEGILKKVRDANYKAPPSETAIAQSPDGFEIRKKLSSERCGVRWAEVEKIIAYKRDLFSYDCICVMFDLIGGASIEIDETMDGFVDVMKRAGETCAGCIKLDKWYFEIMTPAFKTKLTELYRKNATAAQDVATSRDC